MTPKNANRFAAERDALEVALRGGVVVSDIKGRNHRFTVSDVMLRVDVDPLSDALGIPSLVGSVVFRTTDYFEGEVVVSVHDFGLGFSQDPANLHALAQFVLSRLQEWGRDPLCVEAFELFARRERTSWQVKREDALGVRYLAPEGMPQGTSLAGVVRRTCWYGESIRDVAWRGTHEDAARLATMLGAQVVPEVEFGTVVKKTVQLSGTAKLRRSVFFGFEEAERDLDREGESNG